VAKDAASTTAIQIVYYHVANARLPSLLSTANLIVRLARRSLSVSARSKITSPQSTTS